MKPAASRCWGYNERKRTKTRIFRVFAQGKLRTARGISSMKEEYLQERTGEDHTE